MKTEVMAMVLGALGAIIRNVEQFARLFQLPELADRLKGQPDISLEDFRGLVDELAGNLVDSVEENEGAESTDGVDGTDAAERKTELADALEPLLFKLLDDNQNGKLDGEEVEQLTDFLAFFNRELLERGTADENETNLDVLNEIIADSAVETATAI